MGLADPPSIAGESGLTASLSGLVQSFACFLFRFSGFYVLPGISEPAIASDYMENLAIQGCPSSLLRPQAWGVFYREKLNVKFLDGVKNEGISRSGH